MGSREKSLIAEIERDALDNDRDIASALRKCLSLAGKAGSDELLQWANRELRGYGSEDPLPEYRKVLAPILLDGVAGFYKITGQRISPSSLPSAARGHIDETVHLRHPIGQLETLCAQARARGEAAKFSLPGGAELVTLFNHEADQPYQHVNSLYWSVDASTLASVVDNVRTTLVELVATLRRGLGGDDDAVPSPELAAQAVSIAVYGERAQVSVRDVNLARSGSQVTTTSTRPDASRLGKAVAAIAALVTLAAAGLKLAEALGFGSAPF